MWVDIYERLVAMAARPRAGIPDAVAFARRLGFEPDERQAEVLRSRAKRGILNCSRQWGKSTVAAAKAVHRAVSGKNALVLVASPSQRQSDEFLAKAEAMTRELGLKARNGASLQFPNGSRIVGLPGNEDCVRGFSAVSLLIIDEAAWVSDALYRALRPMLAVSNGDLWMLSTPNGKRGFFYQEWAFGGEQWMRVRAPATECARIPAEYLEQERGALGAQFAQEFLCEFRDSEFGLFDQELIEKAVDEEVEPLSV